MRSKPHFAPPFSLLRVATGPRARTLDVPGYRQVRGYTCGYAVSLMVLRYFRPGTSGRELYHQLGTGRDGTRQTAIIRELRQRRVGANARYDMGFEDYCAAFDAGKPVIGYHHGIEHWVVLYGYARDPRDVIFVADSRAGQPNAHLWQDYAPHLRGFGIVCSDRCNDRQRGAAESPPLACDWSQLAFDFG